MGIQFVKKRPLEKRKTGRICVTKQTDSEVPVINKEVTEQVEEPVEQKNKKKKATKNMDKEEKIQAAEEILDAMKAQEVKVVKKDKGLIERTESSKIILTEDNRQVLND